ncbi:MAG: acetate kinase [Lentilactobacillus diolivorans]|jgi:acetate kinase|uniref:Acetate kinase n=2 Tax=Lentilactobacillus diolivorans TaxID=179838 RepID=A0A0R1S1D2_9LACO|nr:acetate kinase [Lentilactobacillus diolivorans]RRG02462.1 MAG: acetate kinase [Lactobacillus sp.]KRL62473.1 pduw protein [Lentilactobacillus diolivorans DSM 14421]MCH4164905.1 acetate kinase [Lentilactobacillus diolivorans]MDH5105188.1 acetate kinase [Lentilactobacillus diolivorans]GEP24237.1 acetate kinase [Lentilactobacillus diolivorans]
MAEKILAINAGSSSLKFKLYLMPAEQVLVSGLVDRIGHDDAIFTYHLNGDKHETVQAIADHLQAVKLVIEALLNSGLIQDKAEIVGVGHRVSHGGSTYTKSVEINADVMKQIDRLSVLSPLHNPVNLVGIKAFETLLPDAREVAVFDTSFHSTMPASAYTYALPHELVEKYGIRRYGFHGQSHEYVYSEALRRFGETQTSQMISCHLGNGASVCAIKNGESVNTSMGFTPLAGLVMGTRSGDIDPGIVPFIEKEEHLSAEDVRKLLNSDSGLQGISGLSNDVRDILEAEKQGNQRAKLALAVYVHQILEYIGAYTTDLGGLKTLVFTAGVGEHSAPIRERICSRLGYLGVKIDSEKNHRNDFEIQADDSQVKVLVIPTDEELVISRETVKVLDS